MHKSILFLGLGILILFSCSNQKENVSDWRVPQLQANNIHANTPVYNKGIIYC